MRLLRLRSILAHLGLVLAILAASGGLPASAGAPAPCAAGVEAELETCCGTQAPAPRCCCVAEPGGGEQGLESSCDCKLRGADGLAVLLLPPPSPERSDVDALQARALLPTPHRAAAVGVLCRAPIEARIRPGPNLIVLHRVYRI
ncbi:MAG: hypothetical protein AAFZ65_04205 [Planctomycetota bacterium]